MKPNEGILDILNLGYCSKHIAQGESVQRPVLEIGNTNSRYRFSIGAKRFMNDWSKQGPAHHCAIGVGHIARKIEKFGKLIGMKVVKVG
jgi:L-arabinose isomerase